MDETYNTTRNTFNDFISISGMTININAASNNAKPSYRSLIVGQICN